MFIGAYERKALWMPAVIIVSHYCAASQAARKTLITALEDLITNGREQCCFTLNGFKKDSESSYLDTGRTVTASDSHPETLLSESLLDQPLSEDNQDVSE